MPWTKLDDVPDNLKKISGVALTLAQANWIQNIAESDEAKDADEPWAVAIAQFKKSHEIKDDAWVKKSEHAVHPHGDHDCKCSDCGHVITVGADVKCNSQECPGCGGAMTAVTAGERRGSAFNLVLDAGKVSMEYAAQVAASSNMGDVQIVERDGKIYFYRTADGELETRSIQGVEAFRAGTWTDSARRTVTYTEADIAQMAADYNAILADGAYECPLKLGHDPEQPLLRTDGLPAAGWLYNARAEAGRLLVDVKDVPLMVYDLIKAGGYKKRSAEILHGFTVEATGKKIKHLLSGLSLLGEKMPAIGSLKDIQNLYSVESDQEVSVYSIDSKNNGGDLDMALEEELRKQIADQKTKIDKMETDAETSKSDYATATDKATADLDKLKTESGEKDTKLAEYKAKEDADVKAADEAEVAKYTAMLATRIEPVIAETMVTAYTAADTETRASMYKKHEALPVNDALKEKGKEDGGDKPGAGGDEDLGAKFTAYCDKRSATKDERDSHSYYADFLQEIEYKFDPETAEVSKEQSASVTE